jgi:hypothetical protein
VYTVWEYTEHTEYYMRPLGTALFQATSTKATAATTLFQFKSVQYFLTYTPMEFMT